MAGFHAVMLALPAAILALAAALAAFDREGRRRKRSRP